MDPHLHLSRMRFARNWAYLQSTRSNANLSVLIVTLMAEARRNHPRKELAFWLWIRRQKVLELLEEQSLIQASKKGVDVLGVTTAAVVQHASGVFDALGPSASENAALELSELASQAPRCQKESSAYLGDVCNLTSSQSAGRSPWRSSKRAMPVTWC
jgi:hypothetical protein